MRYPWQQQASLTQLPPIDEHFEQSLARVGKTNRKKAREDDEPEDEREHRCKGDKSACSDHFVDVNKMVASGKEGNNELDG